MKLLCILGLSLISYFVDAQATFELQGKVTKKISSSLPEGADVRLTKIFPSNGAEAARVIVESGGNEEIINLRNIQSITFTPANIKELWQDMGLRYGVYENIAKQGLQYKLRSDLEGDALDFINYVEKNNLLFHDSFIESYLASLVYRIYPLTVDDGRPGILNVMIIKDFTPNAFVYSNGSLVVSTGLLSTINSEQELMGVLAHEVAHFVLDHHVSNINAAIQRQKRAEFWAALATATAAAVDVYTSVNGNNPAPGVLTAGTAVLSFGMAEIIRDRMGLKYSREQELEADKVAVEYMKYVNVDPTALASALNKIKAYSILTGNYMALTGEGTHPAIETRIEKIGIPGDFRNPRYDKIISLINSFNAKAEFQKKHYQAATELLQRNITTDLATEEDYVLIAMTKMAMYDSDIRNREAFNLIQKARSLNVYPTIEMYKQEAIALIRLNQMKEATNSLNKYLESLEQEIAKGNLTRDAYGSQFAREEKEWTLKMIHKVSKL